MMWEAVSLSTIRRATSNPVSPGICTSRNTRSGCSRSIVVSASTPLPACPTTSTPPIWPSRYPSSSRASCSSSTTTAFKSILRCHALGNRELGNFNGSRRALPGHAPQLQLVVLAVNRAEPLVDVAEPDAAVERMLEPVLAHPEAVVVHLDDGVAVLEDRRDGDAPLADLPRQPVLDRVLDERLQDHAGDDDVEGVGADVLHDFQLGTEPHDLDVEIFVDRFELLAQRDEVIRAAH